MPPCWEMLWPGLGHEVTLGYLPYSEWQKPVHAFDLRRQNLYARDVFASAQILYQITFTARPTNR